MRIPGEEGTGPAVAGAKSLPEQLRLLAVLLGAPESTSLDVLDDLRTEHRWLDAAILELKQTPLEQWQAEHTSLFVTGFPKTACPPFKSAYSGQGMSGAAVEDLAGFYQALGLSAQDMPPDYLGTMLECWAYLLSQANEHAARRLWSEHLASWLLRFATDLHREAGLELYRALGEQFSSLYASQSEKYASPPSI